MIGPSPSISIQRTRWRPAEGATPGERVVAEETPVAIVHDGSTTAVMMATPTDLEDFGLSFSLAEALVNAPDEIRDLGHFQAKWVPVRVKKMLKDKDLERCADPV